MKRPLIDPKLKFNEKKHRYTIDKRELRSVTNWIKSFFSPFDEKTVAKYVKAARERKGEKVSIREIKAEWKAKAQLGTKVHKEIEEYIRDHKIPVDPRAEKACFFYVTETQGWDKPNEFPEVRVYSESLLLAGTIDLLVLKHDGSVILVDWKTNNKLYKTGKIIVDGPLSGMMDVNFTQYTLQLSTYAYILEKEYGLTVSELWLVHLEESGATKHDIPYVKGKIEEMIAWERKH